MADTSCKSQIAANLDIAVSETPHSRLKRYKSLEDYRSENHVLCRVLEKERGHREKVDASAVSFLKKVKDYYEKKIEELKKEVDDIKRAHGETKLDLRIAKRDVTKHNDLIKYYKDLKREATDKMKEMEKSLDAKDEQIKKLEENAENLRRTLADVESTKSEYEEHLKNFESEKDRLNQSNDKLKKANDMLKKMCANVEEQVTKFQSLYENQTTEKAKYLEEKQELLQKVTTLDEQVKSTEKKYIEQITSMARTIETLEKQLSEQTRTLEKVKEELEGTKKELTEEKQFHFLHESDIPSLQADNELKQTTIDTLQHRLSKYENDIIRLKEEASKHITNNTALVSQNRKLSQGMEEALIKNSSLQMRLESTLEEMDKKTSDFVREKMKLNETINQQLKLIDMLQDKMEKPKKAWFSLNSPKVHHGPPTPSIQLKEIEGALERERAKNKMLVKQIDETKKELRQYKNEIRRYEKQRDRQGPGVGGKLISDDDPDYRRQLEAELEAITTSSGPSAPPGDFETSSSASTTTTDNNETSEEEKDFTFSDSIIAELDKKVSNIGFSKEC